MDQEKVAKMIKKIRKDNNLTQKQLAEKYNLTYQAVSKWERGLNLPDIALLKQISKDFNVSIDDILDGEFSRKNNKTKIVFMIAVTIIILSSIFAIVIVKINSNNFNFKTLSSTCDKFNISGNIAYNDSKTSIFINNIEYCGGDDTTEYKTIDCTLYEMNKDITKKISECNYKGNKNIKLEDFLKTVTITVDDYKKSCKEYSENSLFLLLKATDKNNKIITYEIPLKFEQSCPY